MSKFYLARVRRIVPLYLFVATMTIVFLFLFTFKTPITVFNSLRDSINIITFGFLGADTLKYKGVNALSLIGIAWSLSYEWKFYLLLPPLYYLSCHSSAVKFGILAILMTIAMRDFYVFDEAVWPFFLTGILCALFINSRSHLLTQLKSKSTLFNFIALLLLAVSIVTPGFFDYKHLFLTGGLFLCLLLGESPLLKSKALVALGQISFSIYLVQYLIITPINSMALTFNISHQPAFAKLLVTFVIAFILILFSSFTYRFIELPGMNGTFQYQFKKGFFSVREFLYRRRTLENNVAS